MDNMNKSIVLVEYEQLYKIVIIGDEYVGKSSIGCRFLDGSYANNYISTIGVDFIPKGFQYEKKTYWIQLWEITGNLRLRIAENIAYRGAHGIIIVFDITNRKSFENIMNKWMPEVFGYARDKPLLLIGNKTDMSGNREVSFKEARNYAVDQGMQYIEISCKKESNLDLIFNEMIYLIQNPQSPPPPYVASDETK